MKPLNFVSLFAGAGGLDLGLEESGWQCKYASDIENSAVSTLEANQGRSFSNRQGKIFANTFIEEADVRNIQATELLAKADIKRGEATLLAGGPPCQSWSSAGHQHGFRDPRGQLFSDFVRIAEQIDARWILFENVRGLLTARGPDNKPGSALELIRRRLLRAGFQSSVCLLNSADYGIPQRRVRLFIIGYKEGDQPPFPASTHSKKTDLNSSSLLPWITLGECLDGIPGPAKNEIIRPSVKLGDELRDIPAGSGVKSPGKKEATRPGGHWGYKQGAFVADLAKTARTVTASGQQDWIRDPNYGLRRLAPRECAAIQSFPQDWVWAGKNSTQYRLIGNAVPPLLARNIGKSLLGFSQPQDKEAPGVWPIRDDMLTPLPSHLQAAISYTMREEKANGASRRIASPKKRSRIELARKLPACCEL